MSAGRCSRPPRRVAATRRSGGAGRYAVQRLAHSGLLLAVLVGGGYLVTGWWQRADRWHARELSVFAGAGLVAFEAVELAWIGFQPLEVICAGIGVTVIVLAWRTRTSQP